MLLAAPESGLQNDMKLVTEDLGLTAAGSEVSVMLSEGRTIRETAGITDRKPRTVHGWIKPACKRCGISRQGDLVRLALRPASLPASRDRPNMG